MESIVPRDMENYKLSSGFVTSGANLGNTKALVDHGDLDSLIGRLMQYIEATYQDKEQRDAQKGIVKSLAREWLTHIYDWQYGWEIAFHVNPDNRKTEDEWTSRFCTKIKTRVEENN